MKRVKKELVRLARKYDAPAAACRPDGQPCDPVPGGCPRPPQLRRIAAARDGGDGCPAPPRRQPVVQFADGRSFRVQLRHLQAI